MPQPRGGGSRSSGGARAGSTRAQRSASASSAKGSARSTSSRGTASRSSAARSRSRSRERQTATGVAEAQLEAVAQRLRRLNERIIVAGREVGEATLSNYEKALKAIAGAVERGPGSSEIEWISQIANAQARFIRDLTAAWAAAARGRLK